MNAMLSVWQTTIGDIYVDLKMKGSLNIIPSIAFMLKLRSNVSVRVSGCVLIILYRWLEQTNMGKN